MFFGYLQCNGVVKYVFRSLATGIEPAISSEIGPDKSGRTISKNENKLSPITFGPHINAQRVDIVAINVIIMLQANFGCSVPC